MNDRIYHEIADDFELMDELRAEKFDVGMAEAFCFTDYSLALFHFLQIAVTIATQSQPMSPFQLYLMGHLSKMKQSEGMPTEFTGIPTMNILRNGGDRMKLLNMRSKEQMAEELKWRRDEVWKHCVEQALAKSKILKGDQRVKFIGGLNFGRPSDIDEKAVENVNSIIGTFRLETNF
ncbi:hypothetical protein niasHT_019663 [Heterodera trifolii]|uniref:Uncharacterized protein n=1 Tax=Heterodera trifolii TaxID=157864 RepID=A0ABD2L5V6_9BILA